MQLRPCELHPELQVLVDHPNGVLRLTYAKVEKGRVQAVALFVPAEPVGGVPCFGVGYAVAEATRGRGVAAKTVQNAIDELRNGLKRNGQPRFYVEAIVARTNAASNRIAARLLSDTPSEGTDSVSGEPIYQYLKLID